LFPPPAAARSQARSRSVSTIGVVQCIDYPRLVVVGHGCRLRARRAHPHPTGTVPRVGEYFEIVADIDAGEQEAQQLADAVVRWLIGCGIIDADPTDCVLGATAGYAPGPRYQAAVARPDDHFLGLRTNGVEVTVGRTVFHPIQGETGPVVCPWCGQMVIL